MNMWRAIGGSQEEIDGTCSESGTSDGETVGNER